MSKEIWTELQPAVREEMSAQWLMSFSDLVALLLAFFVLMFSMRELDLEGWRELRGSMNGVFPSVLDEGPGSPPEKLVEDEAMERRKGSVLPYLMQVWKQKTEQNPVWSGSAVVYAPAAGELWMAWPEGADYRTAADILMKWRNRVRLVAGNASDVAIALGYLQALNQAGVLVAKEVRLTPGVAAGVWLVVEDKQ